MQNQFLELETPPVLNAPSSSPKSQIEAADTDQDVLEQNALEQDASEQEMVATPAQTQAVAALLAATQRKIRRRKRRFWGGFALTEGAIALLVLTADHSRHIDSNIFPLALLLLLAVAVTSLVVMIYTMQSPLDFDLEELERVGGTRAIGPLLDSLLSGRTPGSRQIVYRALIRLLPTLQATDANLLNAAQRRSLNRLLNIEAWPGWWGPKPTALPLSLAILKAYEQVGDAKALPVVARLASIKSRNERRRAVQQAAQACLPLLQSHTVPLDQTQTLLRAASRSGAAPDILLRPATATAAASADELLRAADVETTNTTD